ncbi:glyoxylase-like metal-dependent hydrolase (beta-lactamase superfamily II) [Paenibacillus sp. V4I3]|uniref:MBL fold metallo-hydrolase n=1 Tax=unclassified Paenibacillus TaxID=185978 RepID=UPI00277E4442|nr:MULTISPECIES: MBL fold metallo-hydrolase [unclassified Paenibacillus]MDQ0877493.1 glyoxylase-like metal-dependent hydrolase (beta-lactamase superfamily II) [Paenibacillus sp. V4I3]MDQ0886642.1 glyoxylase-like metal-dependent hydrolase (beta-lactamase superfamily II) [Paenibacillus sp. V4I9]
MLELEMKLGGRSMMIHPVIALDKDSWTLIDTGTPGLSGEILAYAEQAGITGRPLSAIVLTHQDIDHIGSLPEFLEKAGAAPFEVYAHEDDRDTIDGKAPLLKFPPDRLQAELATLLDEVRISFENVFLRPSKTNVTRLMSDGETLPIGDGLTVIHTPGHTPGHVSLYHQASKTLIAGDALVIHNGELQCSSPYSTIDMGKAIRSLEKFKPFDIESVVCYHGGLIRGDINKLIAELIVRL